MNRITFLAGLLLAFTCGKLDAQEGIRWQTDLARARQAASQYGVPLLIHFYGDSCLPCKTLEQRVYSRPEVAQRINTYFIAVKINATHDMKTAAEFQVHSWPTDVYVSPDGKILSRGVCVQDPTAYMQVLQNAAISSNDHMMLVSAQRPSQPSAPNAGIASPQSAYGQLQTGGTNASAQPMNPQMTNAPASAPNYTQSNVQPNYPVSTPSFQQSPAGQNSFVQGGQFAPQNAHNLLPAAGQANTASTLPSSSQSSPIAGQFDLAQQNSVARGPLESQAQPQPLRGAIPGSPSNSPAAMKISTPNLPTPAAPMQQGYAQRSAMPSQYAAIPAGRATTVPADVASAPSTKEQGSASNWAMPNANQANMRTRSNSFVLASSATPGSGITLANPHYNENPSVQNTAPPQAPSQTTEVSANQSQIAASSSQPTGPSFQPVSARTTQSNAPTTEPPASPTTSTTSISSSTQEKSFGLEGYCPVALNDLGKWVVGEQAFAVKHRGKIYRMSSSEAMQKFMALPDAYAPVLSGYDPMVFLDEGKLVDGVFDYGLVDETQPRTIYLFSSQETKAKFEEDFDQNVKALNIMLARTRSKR